ncbi:hypothetical protein CFELI_10910 [Corynebacterium felinum]|uniref:Uncharacterized protein n=1 Tax=Corynebacterium felinum TaxID=131318 RepID=A0ABU2B4R2_9CORY|nr:hypothetical protein [Corynebacterium felinum]WJY95780.1 hypothetical protein CFELI_10910 [Corynebacterium felinum]
MPKPSTPTKKSAPLWASALREDTLNITHFIAESDFRPYLDMCSLRSEKASILGISRAIVMCAVIQVQSEKAVVPDGGMEVENTTQRT